MSSYRTTEIASAEDISDNVIHQRLFFPYEEAARTVSGQLLEVGCGFGRGIEVLKEACTHYTGIDKNGALMEALSAQYPDFDFLARNIPPLAGLEDNSFDYVVSFQVIEHIEDDDHFLKEIHRVLKPGGKAILTTPNVKWTLTRNPWHIREYTTIELRQLLNKHFREVKMQGITGDRPVMEYYERNKASVAKITRFDVLNLQYRLPRAVLQVPYDLMNRLNRKLLHRKNTDIVSNITTQNYFLLDDPERCFDFYCTVTK